MDYYRELVSLDQPAVNSSKTNRHPPYQCRSIPWLDLRVFYMRVSNFEGDDSTPEYLTLNYIALGYETVMEELDGSGAYTDSLSVQLRRDRIDKNSEEVTFVCTDSVRISGSARYEVFHEKDILLSGVMQFSNGNGLTKEEKNNIKRWSIKCWSHAATPRYFLKGKQFMSPDFLLPTVEVYVAGCFSGTPIILTSCLQIGLPIENNKKENNKKAILEPIPESDTAELNKDLVISASQIREYRDYGQHHGLDVDDEFDVYPMGNHIEDDDEEYSWFSAGVRVGVGISLGVCVGVGLGVGLLVRSYQATSRNFRRRLF